MLRFTRGEGDMLEEEDRREGAARWEEERALGDDMK
jgi:hypothetical protein